MEKHEDLYKVTIAKAGMSVEGKPVPWETANALIKAYTDNGMDPVCIWIDACE